MWDDSSRNLLAYTRELADAVLKAKVGDPVTQPMKDAAAKVALRLDGEEGQVSDALPGDLPG
ncbi:hypothetical protein GCM10010315_10090 [Streptomyces luteosporeus]|uniref:Uncharacterized protein n=2 Tax=Streptomyces TaxID=1883 RepID=A0ABN3TLX5_9ACTN